MPDSTELVAFALVLLDMVLTPAPNMITLVSRTISQGQSADLISLCGVALSFVVYMLWEAFGITALLIAVPVAEDAMRLAGAAYLLWLAWQSARLAAGAPVGAEAPPHDSPRKLFAMGFLTNLLNPQIAVMHLSLLPQFARRNQGGLLARSLTLGLTQIAISVAVNASVVVTAGSIATLLMRRPSWIALQRLLVGALLARLALWMVTEARR